MNGWHGHLVLATGWAHYHGPAGDTSFHAHYPYQLVFAAEKDASMQLNEQEVRGRRLFVPSNCPHRLGASNEPLDLVFIEPTLLCEELKRKGSLEDCLFFLEQAKPIVEDVRMQRALAAIDAGLGGKVTQTLISAKAGLSKSSFTNLFRSTLGMPLRRYVLWRRLILAVEAIGAGADATTASHKAGFADSAHFSRTMRETFGVSPSEGVLKIKMSVQ